LATSDKETQLTVQGSYEYHQVGIEERVVWGSHQSQQNKAVGVHWLLDLLQTWSHGPAYSLLLCKTYFGPNGSRMEIKWDRYWFTLCACNWRNPCLCLRETLIPSTPSTCKIMLSINLTQALHVIPSIEMRAAWFDGPRGKET